MIRMKQAPHAKELIMECALAAFARAHINSIDSFRTHESEWNEKKSMLTFTNTTYTEFKTFFTSKLKYFYTDQRGTHQANHADILLGRVAALKHNMADMPMVQNERLEDLESAQAYRTRVAPPDSFCLPRDDATAATAADSPLASNSTLRAMLTEQATQHQIAQGAFEARIEQLVANTIGTGGGNSKNNINQQRKQNDKPRKFRQFKFYCGSHGCNSSHSGKDCRRKRPDHNNEATIANTMGGSTRNVQHHMM